jgi:hypothetical protein
MAVLHALTHLGDLRVRASPPPWKPEADPRGGNRRAGAVLLACPEMVMP